ncbi:hypothetical protein V494_06924, partial [Pseudogymnoascus sp. VKM F-4513 (FW-928)]
DDLEPDQLSHEQDVATVPVDAQQEGDGIEEVPEHKLDSEVVLLVVVERANVKIVSPPRQHGVHQAQQTQNTQQRRDDHARDLEAEPAAVGKGVECVGGALFVLDFRDHDAACCERLFGLGGLRVHAHEDVGGEDGAGDGGEAGGHDLVELGVCEVRDEWADEDGGFALPDEGGGGGDDGFGARDVHGVEEDVGEFGDEELEGAGVVEELHEGDEEDDGGDDVEDEPLEGEGFFIGEEDGAFVGEAEERSREVGDEVEDVVSCFSAQDEDGEDELREHAYDDRVPADHLAVPRRRPEEE